MGKSGECAYRSSRLAGSSRPSTTTTVTVISRSTWTASVTVTSTVTLHTSQLHKDAQRSFSCICQVAPMCTTIQYGPWALTSMLPKEHLNPFSRFCMHHPPITVEREIRPPIPLCSTNRHTFIMGTSCTNTICAKSKAIGRIYEKHAIIHDLCHEADDNLFNSILNNSHHVLHHILPPPSQASQHYSLRSRRHHLQLSITLTSLSDRNFLPRMLQMDSY